MSRLFISYAREDGEQAIRFYNDVQSAGHTPWLDKIDLQVGDDWRQRVESEIARARYFVALMSTTSLNKRGFVQREMRRALDVLELLPIDDRFLLPVRLDECSPKDDRLARLQWVDLFPDYESGLRTFLRDIEVEDRAISRLYGEVGIEVPADIGTWPDRRLFAYIRGVLDQEALERARRDWLGMPEAQDAQLLRLRADEKIEAVALERDFLGGWRRYQAGRSGSKS